MRRSNDYVCRRLMCGSVLATWEALLRQNLAGAVPAPAAQGTLVILSPILPKLWDMIIRFICLLLCHFSCICQRGSWKLKHRLQHLRSPTVECLLASGADFSTWYFSASTWVLQPMAQNCISRLITQIYLSIYVYASVEPFLYAKLVLEQHQWGVSGLAHRLISDGSH